MLRAILLLSLAALTPAATAADKPAPASTSAEGVAPGKDPNEIVCEKQEVLGTRLTARKVCKTRAQWADERRLQRMEIEKAQMNRGTPQGN